MRGNLTRNAVAILCGLLATGPAGAQPQSAPEPPLPVSGSGTHFFTTAVVHVQEPTPTGMIQRSTDVIELDGDLSGKILYHPTSVFDFAAGTLVNTGDQFFSGTIAGSPPLVLHDDEFRFEVDLATGATLGEVHLSRSNDASSPGGWFACDLVVVGTGLTAAGDATFDYSGECVRRGRMLLNDERFEVEVSWVDPRSGDAGQGQPEALTGDSGYFWFFHPENVEITVKVLDGCQVNGHAWVFFGALTDVAFELAVTEVATGRERLYHGPGLRTASTTDTTAFTCD